MVCCVVEGVALLAVDVVALCCALCAEEASIKEASWVRARSWFCGFDERCGSGVVEVVWVLVVAVVKLWSSSTVGAKVVPVGFGMRERAGVGAMDRVPFVVWW